MRTTATMMLGCGQTIEQRMNHLELVRRIQEETGGFTAFIPWTFQRENTSLGRFVKEEATSVEYLKALAISRRRVCGRGAQSRLGRGPPPHDPRRRFRAQAAGYALPAVFLELRARLAWRPAYRWLRRAALKRLILRNPSSLRSGSGGDVGDQPAQSRL